jgi:hypothetical protein
MRGRFVNKDPPIVPRREPKGSPISGDLEDGRALRHIRRIAVRERDPPIGYLASYPKLLGSEIVVCQLPACRRERCLVVDAVPEQDVRMARIFRPRAARGNYHEKDRDERSGERRSQIPDADRVNQIPLCPLSRSR